MARGDEVHATVRRIDSTMLALVNHLKNFGVPKGMGTPLNKMRNSVGDLVAKLEMTQRRN